MGTSERWVTGFPRAAPAGIRVRVIAAGDARLSTVAEQVGWSRPPSPRPGGQATLPPLPPLAPAFAEASRPNHDNGFLG